MPEVEQVLEETEEMLAKPAMRSSWWNSAAVMPLLLLVTIAALDSADKALLAASFPILERILHLDIAALGSFSLWGNLSYALSLPFWGWLVHRYTIYNAHVILASSCLLWGVATLGIGMSSAIRSQAFFRSVNGAALASILPLSQTMLVELVPKASLGRAFGVMGFVEKAAATLAVASVVWFEDENWRRPYILIGWLSIGMAFAARRHLKIKRTSKAIHEDEKTMSLLQIMQRITRIPAFLCLVGQGVFGAIPWDMMSFLLLLFEWRGFTKDQIVAIQFSTGISGTFGGALGGVLGDWFIQRHPLGRIGVAFVSVVGGIIFFACLLFSKTYGWSLIFSNMFHLWGSWTTAGANRPLCAELARNSSERAQIVALWILLEKTAAATLGAPLVGYVTQRMLHDASGGSHSNADGFGISQSDKADALAWNMFCLSTFFWATCAIVWLIMGCVQTRDTDDVKRNNPASDGSAHKKDMV